MKPRIIILFSILVVWCTGLHAQVNGYLGKRFIAGYKAGLAINAYVFGSGTAVDGEKFFALRHTLHADYILGPRFMLGGEYIYSPTTFTATYDPGTGIGTEYDVTTNLSTFSAVFTFHGLAGKSSISPVGDYFQFKLSSTTGKISDQHEKISATNTGKEFTGKLSSFGFGFCYGHNQVVMDNLLLDVGVELNIFPTAWSGEYNPDNTSGSRAADTFINERIATYNLMVFRLGIGGLLF